MPDDRRVIEEFWDQVHAGESAQYRGDSPFDYVAQMMAPAGDLVADMQQAPCLEIGPGRGYVLEKMPRPRYALEISPLNRARLALAAAADQVFSPYMVPVPRVLGPRGHRMLRGTPLARRSRLQRKTRLRPVRLGPPRRSSRARAPEYLRFVRTLPCLLSRRSKDWPCYGRVEAHHTGKRGVGQKGDDRNALAFCSRHHKQLQNGWGYFRGWPKGQVAEFVTMAVTGTQAIYARMHPAGRDRSG
jgi:hypothetical protein